LNRSDLRYSDSAYEEVWGSYSYKCYKCVYVCTITVA